MYIGISYFSTMMIACVLSYIITIYPLYYTFKEANLKNRWMAFIPILGSLKMFNLANIKNMANSNIIHIFIHSIYKHNHLYHIYNFMFYNELEGF